MKNQITIKNLEENLGFFKKMYDLVRIVDPEKKKVIDYSENKLDETKMICYSFWNDTKICDNCISMRAFIENDTFMKLEHTNDKLYMITAIPVEALEHKVVLELLKDVTNSMMVGCGEYEKGDELRNIISEMNLIIVKDVLTELYNRKYIDERLPVDIIRGVIEDKPLSVVMADLDNLKAVNDTYGHIFGDSIIREFGSIILKSLRTDRDWAARFGGDEFLICLNDTDNNTAYEIVDNLRKALEEHVFEVRGIKLKISSSFGIHTTHGNKLTPEEVIDLADKSLYRAKREGKNKVR